jgi:hypothetical protein
MISSVIWKDVEGYEGLYLVSNDGRVRGTKSKKELKYNYTYNGYRRVKLYRDAKGKTFMVHRLVANAFIANPQNKAQVNHKDGNKQNNTVGNLEWVTQAENLVHAVKLGLIDVTLMNKATSKKVNQYDKSGNLIKTWDSMSEAARATNTHIGNITYCCQNKLKSTGGYKWSFVI